MDKLDHNEQPNSNHHLLDSLTHLNFRGLTSKKESTDDLPMQVSLVIHSKCKDEDIPDETDFYTDPFNYKHGKREHLNKQYQSDQAAVDKVIKYVQSKGFSVIESSPEEQLIVIEGKRSLMNKFFKVEVQHFHFGSQKITGHQGNYSIPSAINNEVRSVIGLSKMPITRNTAANSGSSGADQSVPKPTVINGINGYTGADFAKFYNFPTEYNGAGECIGIIALGGGYRKDEMTQYFKDNNISPMPEIIDVEVGAKNSPGEQGGEDFLDVEVCLDIQVAAAAAPGAKIAVYFAEPTDYGLLRAIIRSVHDGKNKPSVVSVSLGNYESHYSQNMLIEYNRAFRCAAHYGMTILCSAGNFGATNYNMNSTLKELSQLGLNVQYPASSPYVLCVGGTSVTIDSGKITKEKIWNSPYEFDNPYTNEIEKIPFGTMSTGGGFSTLFKISQQMMKLIRESNDSLWPEYRGIPDVSANADPSQNGYLVYCDGAKFITGGTSAATPLWAALTARIFQALERRFFMTPILYLLRKISINHPEFQFKGLNPISEGDNIVSNEMVLMGYRAKQNDWSPCGGLGSPNGSELLDELRKLPDLIANFGQKLKAAETEDDAD
ncbi:MAG: S8 family serine peptidase [Bacteroidetes bacterium]|nr:S8 family serine peptidase [Bacteroidota bacterium]